MKIQSVVGLLLLSSALSAAEPPMPAFPDAKIELPPLALGDAARARIPSPSGEPARLSPATGFASAREPRKVSRMPVLRPKHGDTAMVIAPPDDGIDYKLRVKRPDLEQTD